MDELVSKIVLVAAVIFTGTMLGIAAVVCLS